MRRLAAFALPLRAARWSVLRFDGLDWSLLGRMPPHEELSLDRVELALEGAGWRWLRLRWGTQGWRRLWPQETHIWLRRTDHAGTWSLIGAALAQSRGRPWLGR